MYLENKKIITYSFRFSYLKKEKSANVAQQFAKILRKDLNKCRKLTIPNN